MKGFDSLPDNEIEQRVMGDNGALSPLSYADGDLAAYIQVWAGTIGESEEDVQEGGARSDARGDSEPAYQEEGQEEQYTKDQAEGNSVGDMAQYLARSKQCFQYTLPPTGLIIG